MKKIILVGVLDNDSSTNVAQAKYFERLGYTVIPVNYRTIIRNHGMQYFEKLLKHAVEVNFPELVFFSKCNGIPSEIIKWCRDRVVVFYWFMDYLHNVTSEILNHVKNATFVSATSTDVVSTFKEFNPNSHWIIEGFDSDIMYQENLEKEYDITFIGNATEKRIEQLRQVKDVTIFGNGWPEDLKAKKPVYLHDYRRTVCKSKLIINLVHGNIFSNRVVDSLACGTPVISEYCSDLYAKLNTVPTFKDISQVNFDIFKYIKPNQSIRIPSNLNWYSWDNVLHEVMNIANGREDNIYYGDC